MVLMKVLSLLLLLIAWICTFYAWGSFKADSMNLYAVRAKERAIDNNKDSEYSGDNYCKIDPLTKETSVFNSEAFVHLLKDIRKFKTEIMHCIEEYESEVVHTYTHFRNDINEVGTELFRHINATDMLVKELKVLDSAKFSDLIKAIVNLQNNSGSGQNDLKMSFYGFINEAHENFTEIHESYVQINKYLTDLEINMQDVDEKVALLIQLSNLKTNEQIGAMNESVLKKIVQTRIIKGITVGVVLVVGVFIVTFLGYKITGLRRILIQMNSEICTARREFKTLLFRQT